VGALDTSPKSYVVHTNGNLLYKLAVVMCPLSYLRERGMAIDYGEERKLNGKT
jgi:hypothetical protein